MKKLVSLILVLCMACLLIPAMAEEAVTGDWFLQTMEMEGRTIQAAQVGYLIKMTLNEDGTCKMDAMGQVSDGTWTMEGTTITVTVDDSPASGEVADGTITLAQEGGAMIFSREETKGIEIAAAVTAESAEAFYGEYTWAYLGVEGTVMDPAAMGETEVTTLKIGEGTMEFSGEGMYAMILGMMGLQPAFEDGKLALTSTMEGMNASGTAELLEDGMVKISVDSNGSVMDFYFAPAAAGAEAPAA